MNLTEQQDKELSILEVGRAVIHREGMDKAFLVQIDQQKNNLKFITNNEIHEHMKDFHNGSEIHYGLEFISACRDDKRDFGNFRG